jgi:hypothetical protein
MSRFRRIVSRFREIAPRFRGDRPEFCNLRNIATIPACARHFAAPATLEPVAASGHISRA